MTNFMASGMGGQPQPQPTAPAQGQQTPSMNMNVSPEKRGALKNYMEGYKAAIESKTMNNLLPNISSPQQGMPPQGMGQPPMGMPPQMPPQGMMPPQMPQQPPMMPPQPYNYGGMVDVFEPRYMDDGGFVIQTDPSGKIATKSVFDEDRGRMVSQILSRDDMQRSAGGGGLAKIDNVIEDAVLGDVVENLSTKNFPNEVNISDPSVEMYYPQKRTEIEPKISDIIGPESKPTAEDFLYDVTNVVEEAAIPKVAENVAVPLSKPNLAEITSTRNFPDEVSISEPLEIDPFDEARRLINEADKKDANYLDKIENQLRAQTFIDPVFGSKISGDDFSGDWKFEPIDGVSTKGSDLPTNDELKRAYLLNELAGTNPELSDRGLFSPHDYDTTKHISNLAGVELDDAFWPRERFSPSPRRFTPKSGLYSDKNLPEGDFSFSSKVNQDENLDNWVEPNSLSTILQKQIKKKRQEEGLLKGLMAKLGNFDWRYGLRGAPSDMNQGGIVQGFGKGGAISNARRKSDFSSNIGGNVSGRDDFDNIDEIAASQARQRMEDEGSKLSGPDVPVFTIPEPNYGGGEGQLSGSYDPLDSIYDTTTIYPGNTTGQAPTQAGTMGIGEDDFQKEAMVNPGRIADEDYQGYLKSLDSPFANFGNKIGNIMGYKDPFDFYKATQATLDNPMLKQIAGDRKLDQERAERKLAEEQRLRDMIAGMLPPTAATTPTPADPIVTPPVEDTTPPDYTSAVVPSDRIPGFDINKISPYPTFGVPGTPTAPTVIPSGITPELLRNLFKLQGVPATAMNRGGSVNTLDNAVDNFLGSLRSVA